MDDYNTGRYSLSVGHDLPTEYPAKWKPFIDYADGMLRLRREEDGSRIGRIVISYEEYCDAIARDTADPRFKYQLVESDNPEDWYTLLVLLLTQGRRTDTPSATIISYFSAWERINDTLHQWSLRKRKRV